MPWSCPKCGLHLNDYLNAPAGMLPRTGVIYRRPVCKLALSFDPTIQKMKAASAPPDSNEPSGA